MPVDVLVAAVARRGDGQSVLGFTTNGFVRLLAPTPSGILYPEHTRLGRSTDPVPCDLIRVEAPWADKRPGQPENRIIDGTPWQLLERPASRAHLALLERAPGERGLLFGTRGRAVREGATGESPSILYVEPDSARAVRAWDPSKERYRSRLRFAAGGIRYDLPLADRHYNAVLMRHGEGEYTLDALGCRAPHGLRIVVELGEPFQGWCYKSVAGILPRRTVTLWRDADSPSFPPANGNPAFDALPVSGAGMVRA